jgi:outer membrane immunogenic protein
MYRSTGLKILAAAMLTGGFVGAASAADLPAQPVMKAAVVPVWSWTGFYVGVHAGFGGNKYEYPFTVVGTSGTLDLTSSGGFGGGQIGYNWQTSNWVFGIEADIAWASIEGQVNASVAGLSASAGTKLEWFGTVRGRLGYAWDRFMMYATGGYAYGNTKTSASAAGLGLAASFTSNHSKSGWAVGGGFEYALTNRVSVKTEYLYLDLRTDSVFSNAFFTISEKTTAHTMKAGLNFRF